MERTQSGGWGWRSDAGSGNESRSRRRGGNNSCGQSMGDTFQRVMRRKCSGFTGSGQSSSVSKAELEINLEMLGNEMVVKAGKAINVALSGGRRKRSRRKGDGKGRGGSRV